MMEQKRLLSQRKTIAPMVMIGRVDNADHAMTEASASDFGLTAGFFGADDEDACFLDHIKASATCVNLPLDSTAGVWPSYQPFGAGRDQAARARRWRRSTICSST